MKVKQIFFLPNGIWYGGCDKLGLLQLPALFAFQFARIQIIEDSTSGT